MKNILMHFLYVPLFVIGTAGFVITHFFWAYVICWGIWKLITR